MMSGRLLEWQAVKMIFFAPWEDNLSGSGQIKTSLSWNTFINEPKKLADELTEIFITLHVGVYLTWLDCKKIHWKKIQDD